MTREEFVDRLKELIGESKLNPCEIIELSLVELGRISVAQIGDPSTGFDHLSWHFDRAMENLAYEYWRATLH